MKKHDFVVGGYIVANQFLRVSELPQIGVTAWATNDDYNKVFFGGPGLNITYDLGKLGCDVLPVMSYVSDDKRKDIEELLGSVNASSEALQPPVKGSSGVAVMIQDANKNHLVIACRNNAGMQEIPFREMKDEWFAESRYAVLPVILKRNGEEFLKRVRRNNVPLIFSMKIDKKNLTDDIIKEAVELSEIIFMNETEEKYLADLLNLKDINDLFKNEKLKILVTTVGVDGSLIRTRDREIRVPITSGYQVVDATGAGDGYVAGFLYGYLKNEPLEVCGQYGSTLASFIIEKTGSLENAPDLAELIKRNDQRADNKRGEHL